MTLTHCPGSQSQASRCPLFPCIIVSCLSMLCVFVGRRGWDGFLFSFLFHVC